LVAVGALGSGWQDLVDEFAGELRRLDTHARLSGAVVDAHGLLRFRARLPPQSHDAGTKLIREYEERALTTCELCGDGGRVYAGTIMIVRCAACQRG